MPQMSLFGEENNATAITIPGLIYIPNFISPLDVDSLIYHIDAGCWMTDLKRRVQHYGYRYDYKARNVSSHARLEPLPEWLSNYCRQLYDLHIFSKVPDQVIINEYQPGQGIAAHIDCVPCFEETIASISLLSDCIMDFIDSRTQQKVLCRLEAGSLLVLTGEARYRWQHAIAARKTDRYKGQIMTRSRRVSLTFRNVILS